MFILTGGAGFIGSCLLKYLNDKGIEDIIVVDNLGKTGKWKNLVNKKFEDFYEKNEFLEKLTQNKFDFKISTIFHLGACTNTTELDSNYLINNNYKYSKILAKYSLENDIRFIYASSAATFGLGEYGYDDNIIHQLKPINAYGYSKQIFDEWVVNHGYDKNFIGLKFFNVFGPNEYHKGSMASLFYKAFNQVNENKEIKLFKSNDPNYRDGEQDRDFIYVKDVVELTYLLFEKNKPGIYNLGTGIARTWNDLANSVFSAMKIEPKINYVEMPDNLKNQYQNHTQADVNKIKNAIGEYNFYSLEKSVDDYVHNYLSQSWQYL